MNKILLVLSAALIGTTAHAADKMTLQLNWFHLADHSPIYMALKKGYYKEEDLELNVVRGAGSADSAKKIDLKQAEVGISDAPTVITAISKGANLRMVAVVCYDKAGNNAFFKKGANIRSPKDLVGKKVAVPPADSHRVLWPAFAALNKLDPAADAGQREAGRASRRSSPLATSTRHSISTRAMPSGRKCSARATSGTCCGRTTACRSTATPISSTPSSSRRIRS